MNKFDRLKQITEQRRQQQLYRKPRISGSAQQAHMQIDGRDYLSFCSNDYLGLANHPDIINTFQQAASQWGVGSGAAHLINGHSQTHQRLEEALAEFTGRERALLFSTGYMANLGVVSALLQDGDRVYQDRLNHASLLDAVKLSGARQIRFQHNDTQHLRQRMQKQTSGQAMILADGVFSMDGNAAPLNELKKIADSEEALLLVDDAHGFACMGASGKGALELFDIAPTDNVLLMATLGKAVGSFGAFVAGDALYIEQLIQSARSYIYTTALPPAVAGTSIACLHHIAQNGDSLRAQLRDNIEQFKQGINKLGLSLMESSSAIQPLILGDEQRALDFSQRLYDLGFLVSAIRPPTVPKGTARLRFTFSASHSADDISALLEAVSQVANEAGGACDN